MAGVHLSDVPRLDYAAELLPEKQLRSVTTSTRPTGSGSGRRRPPGPAPDHLGPPARPGRPGARPAAAGRITGAARLVVGPSPPSRSGEVHPRRPVRSYPHPVSGDAPDPAAGPALVAAWAAELTGRRGPPPLAPAELDRLLAGAVATLSLAGAAVPLDVERARGVGASLAYAGLVAPDVLPATIAVLGTHLAGVLWAAGAADPAAITPRIVAAVADGYVADAAQPGARGGGPAPADAEVSPALRTSEARFQAVFTHAGTGIILGDPFGRIIDVNASFAEMLGYSIEEIRGRDVREFIHPDEVPRMMDALHRDDRDRRGDPPLRPPLPAPRRARRADRAHLVLRPRRPRRADHGHRAGRGHHPAPRAAAAAAPPGPARPADRAAQPEPVPGAAAGAVRHAGQPGRAVLPRPGPVQGGQRPARARGRRRAAGGGGRPAGRDRRRRAVT